MMNYDNSTLNPADGCLDWDSVIQDDGEDFIILSEGEYLFEVVGFERGRFPGSAKIPPCNKAVLTLQVTTPEGRASIRTDLILYRSLEWKLSSFFRCVGQKRKGERVIMDWNHIVGARGRALIRFRTYSGKDGRKHSINDVDRFLPYDASKMPILEPEPLQELQDNDNELPF